jgi:hypothetical protein
MVERVSGAGGNRLLTDTFAQQWIAQGEKELGAKLVEFEDIAGAHDNIVRTAAEGCSSEKKENICCRG